MTYKGKPHGKPINDLYESDLLWFIRNELTQGREIHIAPESAMIGNTCAPEETPPPQTAPGRKMDKRCVNYVGLACVDGSCPVAQRDYNDILEANDRENCYIYRGCKDCGLTNTEYCKEEFFHGSEK